MRNKKELTVLYKFFYSSEEISAKAMFFIEQYFLSHSMELTNVLIGSISLTRGSRLLTGNAKYYKVMMRLQLNVFGP